MSKFEREDHFEGGHERHNNPGAALFHSIEREMFRPMGMHGGGAAAMDRGFHLPELQLVHDIMRVGQELSRYFNPQHWNHHRNHDHGHGHDRGHGGQLPDYQPGMFGRAQDYMG